MFDPIPVQVNSRGEPYVVLDSKCIICNGTGVRSDISEPRGTANTCVNCSGEGKIPLTVPLFTHLMRRDDVEKVGNRFNRSSTVTYEEFLAGKRP